MLRFSLVSATLACVALAGSSGQRPARAQERKPAQSPPAAADKAQESWEERFEMALRKPISVNFVETPLADMVAFLKKQIGEPILLDKQALDNVGIGTDTPVTRQFANLPLRNVLNLVLSDLGLACEPRDGVLLITSVEVLDSQRITEVFDVSDLADPSWTASSPRSAGDSLVDVVTTTVAPQTWDTVGGPGSITALRGSLTVSQSRAVLDQVRDLLAQCRKAKQLADEFVDKPPPIVSAYTDDPLDAEIRRALEKEVSLKFTEAPLEDVVEHLREVSKVDIEIDKRALDNTGVGTDVPISFDVPRLKLRHAIAHILRPLGLRTIIKDHVLLVTSSEIAESELETRTYPVADLLGRSTGVDAFGTPRRAASADRLQDLITSTLTPQSWSQVGGPGDMAMLPNADVLVISQTTEVHEQIAGFLTKLRKDRAQRPKGDTAGQKAVTDDTPYLAIYLLPVPAAPAASTPPAQPPAQPQAQPDTNKDQQSAQAQVTPLHTLAQIGASRRGSRYASLGDGMGSGTAAPRATPIPGSDLVQLVTDLIEPDSWKARKEVYIKAVPGRLIVRHTAAVQRQVQELLSRLGLTEHHVLFGPGSPAVGGMF